MISRPIVQPLFTTGIGALICSISLSAAAATFTEGDLNNGSSSDAVGQSFQVGLEPTPDPGLMAGDPVQLDSVLFPSGGGGTGSTETYLAIFPGAFFDFNDTTTVGDALGISDNTIDTTVLAYGDPINYLFTGLDLAVDDVVSATFVTITGADELTPIPVSTAFIAFIEDPPGVFNPASNYGGSGNFSAVALFADFDANGFLEAATDAQDLSFQATLSTPIPEPGSLLLCAAGLSLLTIRRLK
jgi:hypothetical protein